MFSFSSPTPILKKLKQSAKCARGPFQYNGRRIKVGHQSHAEETFNVQIRIPHRYLSTIHHSSRMRELRQVGILEDEPANRR